MKRVTLGQLRQAKLPAAKPDDEDLLVSLRKNVDSEHPDSLVLAVPDAMWDLVAKLSGGKPAAEAPVEVADEPTKSTRHR